MGYELGKIYEIALADLARNLYQPRTDFNEEELENLKESIKKHGLLQPILVKELDDGTVMIVSGERRFRACKMIEGKETISVWFTNGDAEELAIIENLVRDDLTPVEAYEAVQKLKNRYPENNEIAKVLGKSAATISELLSIGNLPEKFRNEIRGNKNFSLRRLRVIARIKDGESRQKACDKYLKSVQEKPKNQKGTSITPAQEVELLQSRLNKIRDQLKRVENLKPFKNNEENTERLQIVLSKIDEMLKDIK